MGALESVLILCPDLLDQCRSLLYSLLFYIVKFNMKVLHRNRLCTLHADFNTNDYCFHAFESPHTVGKLRVQKMVV